MDPRASDPRKPQAVNPPQLQPGPVCSEDHSHEWKGVWNRPMHMDERGLHPFTIARMTDHNVKGKD